VMVSAPLQQGLVVTHRIIIACGRAAPHRP
jgi:hypothetical protein